VYQRQNSVNFLKNSLEIKFPFFSIFQNNKNKCSILLIREIFPEKTSTNERLSDIGVYRHDSRFLKYIDFAGCYRDFDFFPEKCETASLFHQDLKPLSSQFILTPSAQALGIGTSQLPNEPIRL
jgi:hypothetical protein